MPKSRSGSSSLRSASPPAPARATIDDQISRLQKRIGGGGELTASAHLSGLRILKDVRLRVLNGEMSKPESNAVLVCIGVSIDRRRHLVNEAAAELELRRTALLVFLTICAIQHQQRGDVDDTAVKQAVATMTLDRETSLFERLYAKEEEPEDCIEDLLPSQPPEPKQLPDDAAVALAALTSGVGLLCEIDINTLEGLSEIFFRSTSRQLALTALGKADGPDFLSLSATQFSREVSSEGTELDRTIEGIVAAGESESGQAIIRDLMLSFMLPARVVGVRRTLLLPRAASTEAAADFSDAVQSAHEAAMAGAEWLYKNSNEELRRVCALLAAVACLTTKSEDGDPSRKGNAFGGRVSLPFLLTKAPEDASLSRIALIPTTQKWVLFKLGAKGVEVLSSAVGMQGLKLAVSSLLSQT